MGATKQLPRGAMEADSMLAFPESNSWPRKSSKRITMVEGLVDVIGNSTCQTSFFGASHLLNHNSSKTDAISIILQMKKTKVK